MSASSPSAKRQKTTDRQVPPDVEEISEEELVSIAKREWAKSESTQFSSDLVSKIYSSALRGTENNLPSGHKISSLEISQYLEKYLWPYFIPEASPVDHVVSILLLVNHKCNEKNAPWTYMGETQVSRSIHDIAFTIAQDKFEAFMKRVLSLNLGDLITAEKIAYVQFTMHCFRSLENGMIRSHVLKLVSLPLWHNLSPGRLEVELMLNPSLHKRWKRLLKKESKSEKGSDKHEASFLNRLVSLLALELRQDQGEDQLNLTLCQRLLELFTDLLSQLPTRRFVKLYFQEKAVHVKCKMSDHYKQSLFRSLVDKFVYYLDFNVDEHTGDPFSEEDYVSRHYDRLSQLQRLMFRFWKDSLHDFAMMDCATLQKRSTLNKIVDMSPDHLKLLVITQLKLVSEVDPWIDSEGFLKEVFISHYEKRELQREQINAMPLFPTENLLWDSDKIPDPSYTTDTCLAMPRLNLQFLSLYDYLQRNFEIYRLGSAYDIREDLTDVLSRMGPAIEDDELVFKGWARMATPITGFKVVEVQKPKIGYDKPASVKAEIQFSTRLMRKDVKAEWDCLKQHDVLFLLSLDPNAADPDSDNPSTQYGLRHVRGCETLEIKDEEGKLMNDFSGRTRPDPSRQPAGFSRTLLVSMDCAQYYSDAQEIYSSFSLLVRRRPKENNFKSVLECVRDLMNESSREMEWIQDVFLGYGQPSAAHYTQLSEGHVTRLDMKDTFVDLDHIRESFPGYSVQVKSDSLLPPFRLYFSVLPGAESEEERKLAVESYVPIKRSPFPEEPTKGNEVRFTPVQVGAIVAGMQKGLSMVVGPPGSGKTDTAVQVLHMLYNNFPGQRTILITHSNHALNDIFQKLMSKDVPDRYLLRLGTGEQDLETDLDFSRAGRVNAMLARRLDLLEQVQLLAKSFGVNEDMAYSCETAGHFWLLHVLSRWEKFLAQAQDSRSPSVVSDVFPFKEYFKEAEPLFEQTSFENDLKAATVCFRYLRNIFQELEECRPFELLRSQHDRANYLLTKQAKIIAMTCTHAALKRKEFLHIGFQYDNVLMEESAQVLEIETYIPWTLQKPEESGRLRRIILIGDHHQLPPVVKHPAIQRYGQMDQSLFARFIRLGMPYLELNAQGRCRPSIAKLFNWRYKSLGDLPLVTSGPAFSKANAGFTFDYQFVNVVDPDGIGESVPTPYFYQNLAEAEYVVRVYMYMRLLGYPASSISILSSYNGQKHLIKDVLSKRCLAHPAFGSPHKVTTVDKFQGQQNDYILLSLVRTRSIGHIRDIRRLTVATSRARFGLYIFGTASLFESCYEMQPVFSQLAKRPMDLYLVKSEAYGHCARDLDEPVESTAISGLEQMDTLVKQLAVQYEIEASQRRC